MSDSSDRELLEALGVSTKTKAVRSSTPREERIITGFEEIQKFVDDNGRSPNPGDGQDIFERLYATRIRRIRELPEAHKLLAECDYQNLLENQGNSSDSLDSLDDTELLAELGVERNAISDVTKLRHVKPRRDVKVAEDIAKRKPCKDFEQFRALFGSILLELEGDTLQTRAFEDYAEIRKGDLFILSGQVVFVASVGEEFTTEYNRRDSRLRVIYDNGTESDILLRSLQRALNKDSNGRRIIEQSFGPLFDDQSSDNDFHSGIIYVLRSKSSLPEIKENHELLHKIGVTRDSVEKRISNAENDATFLLANVEVVASYQLYNIKSSKLESLIHRFFDGARLDIEIKDRFGKPVSPREWFLVPLFVIEEFVDKLMNGSIQKYIYDPESASLVRR